MHYKQDTKSHMFIEQVVLCSLGSLDFEVVIYLSCLPRLQSLFVCRVSDDYKQAWGFSLNALISPFFKTSFQQVTPVLPWSAMVWDHGLGSWTAQRLLVVYASGPVSLSCSLIIQSVDCKKVLKAQNLGGNVFGMKGVFMLWKRNTHAFQQYFPTYWQSLFLLLK